MNRRCQGLFNRPLRVDDTLLERGSTNADSNRPVSQRQGLALKCEQAIASFVSALFSACRPPAVPWRVWTVVVFAVNAVCRGWAPTHVRVELFEFLPRRIDRYAAAAVVCVARFLVVCAALPHSIPDEIFRRLVVAVRGRAGAHVTAARHDSSSVQMLAPDDLLGAAFAPAIPRGVFRAERGSRQNSQASERAAGQVGGLLHGPYFLIGAFA